MAGSGTIAKAKAKKTAEQLDPVVSSDVLMPALSSKVTLTLSEKSSSSGK